MLGLPFRALWLNSRRYRQDFFCLRQPHVSPRLMAICGGTVTDTGQNGYHRSFEWYHRRPLQPTFTKIGGPKCTTKDQLADMCCHLANIIEDIDKASACRNVIMSRALSPFATLLWPFYNESKPSAVIISLLKWSMSFNQFLLTLKSMRIIEKTHVVDH